MSRAAFAVTYGRVGRPADAEAAVRHLRAAQGHGFRTDPIQTAVGTIRGSFGEHLAADRDMDPLREYGPFRELIRELGDSPATRTR